MNKPKSAPKLSHLDRAKNGVVQSTLVALTALAAYNAPSMAQAAQDPNSCPDTGDEKNPCPTTPPEKVGSNRLIVEGLGNTSQTGTTEPEPGTVEVAPSDIEVNVDVPPSTVNVAVEGPNQDEMVGAARAGAAEALEEYDEKQRSRRICAFGPRFDFAGGLVLSGRRSGKLNGGLVNYSLGLQGQCGNFDFNIAPLGMAHISRGYNPDEVYGPRETANVLYAPSISTGIKFPLLRDLPNLSLLTRAQLITLIGGTSNDPDVAQDEKPLRGVVAELCAGINYDVIKREDDEGNPKLNFSIGALACGGLTSTNTPNGKRDFGGDPQYDSAGEGNFSGGNIRGSAYLKMER